MQYGYFDNDNREYVITNPHTPVKWINFIGTRKFGGFVDHTGGALICRDDPTYNRITKYVQQMPSSDFKGETLYLRVHQPGGYQIFSPFYVPTLDQYQDFECRIGLGYSCWRTIFDHILTDVTVFVPRDAECEIRRVSITNMRDEPLKLDAIPLVEFTHPDALRQLTNADWVPQTMQCHPVKDGEHTILIQYPFMLRDTCVNYLAASQPASSFETDRRRFLGANEYGSFRQPLSLKEPELSSTPAFRGDTIGALLLPLGTLHPGDSVTFITQLGQAAQLEDARDTIVRFRNPAAVDESLNEQREYWDEYLGALQVNTPDDAMNTMLNIFNPYQCHVTRTWSRYLSYYQLGMGSRGIGMRDSCQDIMAVVVSTPDEARDFLRTLLSFQKADGSAMHQYNPLTMEGSAGDSLEQEDRPHYFSDDHLWLVLAVCAYLKETGDMDFLEVRIGFYEEGGRGSDQKSGTVMDHLLRALAFTSRECGQHQLPLLGYADWNDTVNLPGGAESLFTANLYGLALLEMISLLVELGDQPVAEKLLSDYEEMKSRVETQAWDGAWYVRYFDADGNPVGSSRNVYNQISLNAQSWAVISGFASPERARQAMDSVFKQLNTSRGIMLSTPGFNGYDPAYGGVTTYPPGAKENSGIFLHPNPWAVIAEARLGRGDRAYQYYSQINPAGKNDLIEEYEVEPYVYAQNILGKEHPQFGLGRNSWLSGTASWCYQAATQWILGVRAEYAGLRIDPCIPADWDGFQIKRRFRGRMYEISVRNPENVCRGISRLLCNGEETGDTLLPWDAGSGTVPIQVEVWLGND